MTTKNLSTAEPAAIMWFRRDLRLSDHPALSAAIEASAPIIPVYILDDETPGTWRMGGASRWWLAQSLRSLEKDLRERGSRLILRRGRADTVLGELVEETAVRKVYFTRGYEPFQRKLEERLQARLAHLEVECRRFGGQILVEPEELSNKAGEPFRVYSPFYRALAQLQSVGLPLPPAPHVKAPSVWPSSDRLESWGLEPKFPDWAGGIRAAWSAGEASAQARLQLFIETMEKNYRERRNFPGIDATSRLSPHLAFGEISPRQIWNAVLTAAEAHGRTKIDETYLREIAWREFSYHLLFHFPTLPEKALRPEFDAFPWRSDRQSLSAWKKGETGYPIVDAGMRQLWQTGWMHNRVRMIVASFLIKHLMIPWQTGEAWFWDTLVDADLANNAASWQWVAGSGADAAPYFRVFNPVLQGEKFDADGDYVRTFCPELARLPNTLIHKPWEANSGLLELAGVKLGETYPYPIIAHGEGRERALAAYAKVKKPV